MSRKVKTMKGFKRSLLLLLMLLLVVGTLSATPFMAHDTGDDSPDHAVREIACEYNDAGDRVNSVEAFPPEHASSWSEDDRVSWKPILYRWDGVRYHKWKEYKEATAYAYVTPEGLKEGKDSGWRDNATDDEFGSLVFTNLPSGSFAVINEMTWESNGQVHREVSPNWCGN